MVPIQSRGGRRTRIEGGQEKKRKKFSLTGGKKEGAINVFMFLVKVLYINGQGKSAIELGGKRAIRRKRGGFLGISTRRKAFHTKKEGASRVGDQGDPVQERRTGGIHSYRRGVQRSDS